MFSPSFLLADAKIHFISHYSEEPADGIFRDRSLFAPEFLKKLHQGSLYGILGTLFVPLPGVKEQRTKRRLNDTLQFVVVRNGGHGLSINKDAP
jgi:hypothetical protein